MRRLILIVIALVMIPLASGCSEPNAQYVASRNAEVQDERYKLWIKDERFKFPGVEPLSDGWIEACEITEKINDLIDQIEVAESDMAKVMDRHEMMKALFAQDAKSVPMEKYWKLPGQISELGEEIIAILEKISDLDAEQKAVIERARQELSMMGLSLGRS